MTKHGDNADIQKLIEVMAALRDPQSGCPWDLQQSFRSIAPYTVEEAYEVADAIEREAPPAVLADELGDLLLQVVYHARLAEEAGDFAFADVVAGICDKMIRRHPHVFGDQTVDGAAAQSEAWETIKANERAAAGAGESAGVLAGIARALPALTRATKLGRRAARVGFDWPEADGARAKVIEELDELDEAIAAGDQKEMESEAGDLLFAVANFCRHLGVDPEQALRGANTRFESRFAQVEQAVVDAGGDWSRFDIPELEAFWQQAKARVRAT